MKFFRTPHLRAWVAASAFCVVCQSPGPAQELDLHLKQISKAIDTKASIDLDDTLDAMDALNEAKVTADKKREVKKLLTELLAREDPVKLSGSSSRVPPLMLLKAEAVRLLRKFGDADTIPAIRAFQKRDQRKRFFPEEAVEQAIEQLSKTATDHGPTVASDAWREPWKKTEDGRRFLALSDQMATGRFSAANNARSQLIRSGNPVVDFLVDSLIHHEHFVGRRSSAYLLGQIDDPLTVPYFIKALDEKHENVLWTVITSAGFMEDKRATEKVIPLLDHKRDRIRVAAAQALVRLRDPLSLDALIKHIDKYKIGRSRARAAEALGEIGDRRAMPILFKTMTNKHIVTREHAAMAYGKLVTEAELFKLTELIVTKKLDPREVQLAFEEHYQADFSVPENVSLSTCAKSFKEQVEAIKEGKARKTRLPTKSDIEREVEKVE
jgi:HEAT repeat protein